MEYSISGSCNDLSFLIYSQSLKNLGVAFGVPMNKVEIALKCAITLAKRAKGRRTRSNPIISYSELGRKIGYRHVSENMAGVIVGKRMCLLRDFCLNDFSTILDCEVPRLNAIVVPKHLANKHQPPDDWHEDSDEGTESWQNEVASICNFARWSDVVLVARVFLEWEQLKSNFSARPIPCDAIAKALLKNGTRDAVQADSKP